MKKKIIIIFLISIFLSLNLFAINITYLGEDKNNYHNHEIYSLIYNFDTKNPIVVWWSLTNTDAIESDEAKDNRTNDFRPCSLGSSKPLDYYKKGFDKGHLCPNNDFDFSKTYSSLTFLMCNMCPQTSKLNRGSWKSFESYTHKIAKTYGKVDIVCGPLYDENKSIVYIGDSVRIPDKFFKILHYFKGSIETFEIRIFEQSGNWGNSTLEEIENLANIKISF